MIILESWKDRVGSVESEGHSGEAMDSHPCSDFNSRYFHQILGGSASPWASQGALVVKNPPANAGDVRDMGSVPGVGRSPGGGHGNPLQYSSLENRMDRAAWWAAVHGVTKSQTQLKQLSMHACQSIRSGQACL